MTACDFARSYLRFQTGRVNHTPRLQLDAACLLRTDGQERRFVLTSPCIGENMYVASGLIQQPPAEFVMIAEHRAEYAVRKRYASAAHDVYETHRFGEPMSTHSGTPATVTALDVHLATYAEVQPLATYEAFRSALLENRPVTGRSTYLGDDGRTTIVLEYPAKVINVAHGRPAWQVDCGPVLVPDLSTPLAPGEMLSGRFDLAYLVFNTWRGAEIVVRRPVALGRDGDGATATAHYAGVRVLDTHNELFAANAG